MAESEMTETADYDKSADPTDHASSHEVGGSDEINAEGLDHQVCLRAYLGTSFALVTNTMTDIPIDTIAFDRGSDFNIATHRFVAPSDGKYLYVASGYMNALSDGCLFKHVLRLNGANYLEMLAYTGAAGEFNLMVSVIMDLAANDYVNMACRHDYGSNRAILKGTAITYLCITKLY